MKHIKFTGLFLLSALALFTSRTNAATNRFNLLTFKPSLNGFISVEDAKNPDFKIGTMFVYEKAPLDLRVGGVKQRDIVDNLFVNHFYLASPIFSWLSAGIDTPLALRYSFSNPDATTTPPTTKQTSFGDLTISAKALLLNREHFGIALIPTISVPTGDQNHFMGNDGITGGGKLAFYFPKLVEPLDLGVNVGVTSRKRVTIRNINFKEQLLLSGAAKLRFAKNLAFIAEGETTTPIDEIFNDRENSPTEVRGAFEWNAKKVRLLAGAGSGLIYGAGAPQFETFALLEFHSDANKKACDRSDVSHKRDVIQPTFDKKYIVTFKFDSAEISDEGAKILGRVADAVIYSSADINIKLIGSADDYGDDNHNRELAKSRAMHVKNYLVLRGVNKSKITSDITEPKRGKENRKVDIYLE